MSTAWTLNPSFFDEQVPLPNSSPPESLRPNELVSWETELKSLKTLHISGSVQGVARQSLSARDRYYVLTPFEEQYGNWVLPKILLAEVHFLMNDSFGALTRAKEVQEIVGAKVDQVLDNAVVQLQKLSDAEGDEPEDDYLPEDGWKVSRYVRPSPFTATCKVPWNVQLVQVKWKSFQATFTESVAWDRFARHAAIATNVLEGVFSLEAESWSRLVTHGFVMDSIEEIPATSRIHDKKKLIDILHNTDSCLSLLEFDPKKYSDDMIKGLHSLLLQGDNANEEEDEDGTKWVSYVARGEFRRVPCFAPHPSRNLESRFCNWRDIDTELEWYLQEAQRLLARKDLDPFMVSAWLQRSFLRIHPFADGNGRVARLLSSIPLVKVGLPPIIVSDQRKNVYFDALIEADESGDLSRLATFLLQETSTAISDVLEMSSGVILKNDTLPASTPEVAKSPVGICLGKARQYMSVT